jgi:hypothetical protein
MLAIFVCCLLTAGAFAQCRDRGTWTARPETDNADQLNFRLGCDRDQGSMGQSLKATDFQGLDPAAIHGSHTQVKFRLMRDAGILDFEGYFNQGIGYGEFTFSPNAEFLSAMKQFGFADVDYKAFTLMLVNVTRAYVKELRELGFNPTLDKVIEARIFNVDREEANGLKAVGVTELSLDNLVQYRIFHVTPEYVTQMRAAFPGISLDKMVEMRIQKVTPEFAKEMAGLGYSNLNADQLIAFRIHGVTPEFIQAMAKMGFGKIDADQLIQFKIFNVNADQVQELGRYGYKDLSSDQLIAFRIHHVDSAFIEKVKKAGYEHPSADELVQMKILGIRHREAGL